MHAGQLASISVPLNTGSSPSDRAPALALLYDTGHQILFPTSRHQILVCLHAGRGLVYWSFGIPGQDHLFGMQQGPTSLRCSMPRAPNFSLPAFGVRAGLLVTRITGPRVFSGCDIGPRPCAVPCCGAPNFGLPACGAKARISVPLNTGPRPGASGLRRLVFYRRVKMSTSK